MCTLALTVVPEKITNTQTYGAIDQWHTVIPFMLNSINVLNEFSIESTTNE